MRFPISDQEQPWPYLYCLATIARTGFQGHPRSMIFISSDRAYATFY